MQPWLPHLYAFARLLPLAWALWSAGKLVPRVIALSLALALSSALAGSVSVPDASSLAQIALGLVRELCIGGVFAIAIALALSSVGWTVRLAQPRDTRAAVAPISTAYALCAAWLVLSLGGLRAVVHAVGHSFRELPSGDILDPEAFALGVAQLVAVALGAALGLALPLAVAAVLLELGLALMLRAVWAGPREAASTLLVPWSFLLLCALMLVPLVMRAPELVRDALEAARALTRTLAR